MGRYVVSLFLFATLMCQNTRKIAFEDMLKANQTLSIAVSNFNPDQLDCLLKVCFIIKSDSYLIWIILCPFFPPWLTYKGQDDNSCCQSTPVLSYWVRIRHFCWRWYVSWRCSCTGLIAYNKMKWSRLRHNVYYTVYCLNIRCVGKC